MLFRSAMQRLCWMDCNFVTSQAGGVLLGNILNYELGGSIVVQI